MLAPARNQQKKTGTTQVAFVGIQSAAVDPPAKSRLGVGVNEVDIIRREAVDPDLNFFGLAERGHQPQVGCLEHTLRPEGRRPKKI
jgi:hypothetical protein